MIAAPQLTQQEITALMVAFHDHEQFTSHLTIRNKDGISVPYRMSPAGRKLSRSIKAQEQAGKPVRQCVLKASQVFMSSSAATEIFRRVPFLPGRRALVLADSSAHAALVFEYYTQYIKSYQENPFGAEWNWRIKLPKLVKDTEQWLRWQNDSSILIGTASNVDIGRSAPYNWAHLSEAAFYGQMGALMTGLMQRIPNSPDSGVIIESTANGMGGDFYDLCQRSMDPRHDTGWAFVFFAWWEHPEYALNTMSTGEIAAFQRTLTREEINLQSQYGGGLTIPQLAWRRWCIESNCDGKVERFHQEFPSNPQEAFQSSGRTIFDMEALARMPVVQAPMRGRLEIINVGVETKPQFLQSPDNKGELTVFRLPQPNRRYLIGVDHAEGIDPSQRAGGGSDPDYCAAQVLDLDTGEQCATLWERYEPRPWAERVVRLARWYGWAFLVPEQKAVGKAVIGHLLDMMYPLEFIYSARRDPSDRRPAMLQELGYDTNTVLRPVLVSTLDHAIREMAIQVHDPQTAQECREFVRKATGREEGMRHDDLVFALALAVVGLPQAHKAFAYRAAQAQKQGGGRPVISNYRRKGRDDDDD